MCEKNYHFTVGLVCGIALALIVFVALRTINTSKLPQAWIDREGLVVEYDGQPHKLIPVEPIEPPGARWKLKTN